MLYLTSFTKLDFWSFSVSISISSIHWDTEVSVGGEMMSVYGDQMAAGTKGYSGGGHGGWGQAKILEI